MIRILPAWLGSREIILCLLAVGMAAGSGWLVWTGAQFGGGAWALLTILGTVILVTVAGSNRCFFTALFTGLLTLGLVGFYFADLALVRHQRPSKMDVKMTAIAVELFFILPVAFAWLVTLTVRLSERPIHRPAAGDDRIPEGDA